jgi:hypothetical protein
MNKRIDILAMLEQVAADEEKYPHLKRMGLLHKMLLCHKCDEEYFSPWKPGACGCLIPLENE